MVNTKEIYNRLLGDSSLLDLIGGDKVFSAWPNLVDDENFPCVIFLDENQSDGEYADNRPIVARCSVAVHIFTKKVEEFATSSEIGMVIARIMGGDDWSCTQNGEVPDPLPDAEHRVMKFSKSIYAG